MSSDIELESPTCPFCRSAQTTTTDKAADNVYWRCQACGQIWNPSRLKAFERTRLANRWPLPGAR